MVLARGHQLGRYEILAPLGAGGMGEVYRALDTELEREVAIKVLPESFATDLERLERFRRETRAVATLSHPNILEIFDVGSQDGLDYAVTELLEGETLRQRLPSRGMPWQKAAAIGSAIADGVAAAHGKGIIHRDLKPENVFLTSDGRVKVLDFGLARVVSDISPEAQTGTLTPAGTQTGTILGTLGYMAPEQVRGRPADQRSDIFALGSVLYEMVAGRRAFGGDTAPDTMAAILREDPPPLSATGATLPAELERIVSRCLEKSPEARFQSAADLAYSLKAIATGPSVPIAPATGNVAPRTETRRAPWVAAAGAAALVAAAAFIGWVVLRSPHGGQGVEVAQPAPAPNIPWIEEWQVAVAPFDNRTGDPSLDSVGRTLADRVIDSLARITQGLQSLPEVTVVAADTGGLDTAAAGRDAGREVSRLLVTGSYASRGSGIEIGVQIRDPDTREVLYSTPQMEISRIAESTALTPLLEQVMGAVGTHVSLGLERVSHVPEYRVLRQYITRVEQTWSGGLPTWREEFAAILKEDPEFLAPAFFLVGGGIVLRQPDLAAPFVEHIRLRRSRLTQYERLMLTMYESSLDGAPARALQAARELQRIAPDDLLARIFHAEFAEDLGDNEEVVDTLSEIVDRLPRSLRFLRVRVLRQLMSSYQALDRHEDSLALARHLRRELPGETDPYTYEARALAALGRLDELAATVADCERVPGGQCDIAYVLRAASWDLIGNGHRDAGRGYALRSVEAYRPIIADKPDAFREGYLSALRAAELWQEYHDYAQRFAASADGASDSSQYALCCVGMGDAHLGNRIEAEAIMSRFASEENFLYAGYVAAHLGELDRAVEYLRRSVATEGTGYGQFPRWDLDIEPLWGYPPFEALAHPPT